MQVSKEITPGKNTDYSIHDEIINPAPELKYMPRFPHIEKDEDRPQKPLEPMQVLPDDRYY